MSYWKIEVAPLKAMELHLSPGIGLTSVDSNCERGRPEHYDEEMARGTGQLFEFLRSQCTLIARKRW